MNDIMEHLMIECERYEYSRTMMLGPMAEEIRGEKWSERREKSVSRQMEYMLKSSTEWRRDICVVDSVKIYF